jgi:hypothetical protein
MRADYSVSCSSAKYHLGFLWAIVCIVIYPVGIPSLYFYLLYNSRADIAARDYPLDDPIDEAARARRLSPLSFLFESYRPSLWYWEIIETAQRLLLTGILVLVGQGSAVQIIVGSLLTLVFMQIYQTIQPYADPFILPIKVVSQWQIFFVFYITLLLKADFPSLPSSALAFCVMVTMLLNIFLDLYKLFSALMSRRSTLSLSSSPPTVSEASDRANNKAFQFEAEMHRSVSSQKSPLQLGTLPGLTFVSASVLNERLDDDSNDDRA